MHGVNKIKLTYYIQKNYFVPLWKTDLVESVVVWFGTNTMLLPFFTSTSSSSSRLLLYSHISAYSEGGAPTNPFGRSDVYL
jgi:hypothetical protein